MDAKSNHEVQHQRQQGEGLRCSYLSMLLRKRLYHQKSIGAKDKEKGDYRCIRRDQRDSVFIDRT